jgi:hypothetical protein
MRWRDEVGDCGWERAKQACCVVQVGDLGVGVVEPQRRAEPVGVLGVRCGEWDLAGRNAAGADGDVDPFGATAGGCVVDEAAVCAEVPLPPLAGAGEALSVGAGWDVADVCAVVRAHAKDVAEDVSDAMLAVQTGQERVGARELDLALQQSGVGVAARAGAESFDRSAANSSKVSPIRSTGPLARSRR